MSLIGRWKVLMCTTLLVLFAASAALYYHQAATGAAAVAQYQTPQEQDPYVRFDMEAYDDINTNYWMAPSELNVPQLFLLSAQKVVGPQVTLATTTRAATAAMLASAFAAATSSSEEEQMALGVLQVALYNLPPAGRDQLLSQTQEVALRQEVSNINPSSDLYATLGTQKGTSTAAVEQAYEEKSAELKASTTPEAKQELAAVNYAHEVLANQNSKSLYDQAQIEPTVFPHTLGHTLYLYIDKISPTTLQEFAVAVDAASTTPNLDSMILDLRGNIGGDLSFTQNFLGLFIGANQYAFDLFHQGDYQVQRTTEPQFGELSRYKDMAILTDNMTQSTAELTAATFERFHLAETVGVTTRGWGTVENTYPMTTPIDPNTKYTLLLVNSITLRQDNLPIEGRGVTPDIDTSTADWKSELSQDFTSASLIAALKQEATAPPLQ